ncbi:unnamed protein product [Phytomonas sp. Hart1]|nr:unnamed protein product [Phytomonas sp. Hart1]|eukprot:CCW69067.1 unnamed protein product [Phytomonas sp. isolate Hart1]
MFSEAVANVHAYDHLFHDDSIQRSIVVDDEVACRSAIERLFDDEADGLRLNPRSVLNEIHQTSRSKYSRTLSTEASELDYHGASSASILSFDLERTSEEARDSAQLLMPSIPLADMAKNALSDIAYLPEGAKTDESDLHYFEVKDDWVLRRRKSDHLDALYGFSEATLSLSLTHAATSFIQTEAAPKVLTQAKTDKMDELRPSKVEESYIERRPDASAAEVMCLVMQTPRAVNLFHQFEEKDQHGDIKDENKDKQTRIDESYEETAGASAEATTEKWIEQADPKEKVILDVSSEAERRQIDESRCSLMIQAMIESFVNTFLNDCVLEAATKFSLSEKKDTENVTCSDNPKLDVWKETEAQSKGANTNMTNDEVVATNTSLTLLASNLRLFPNEEDRETWSIMTSVPQIDVETTDHIKGGLEDDRGAEEVRDTSPNRVLKLFYPGERGEVVENHIASAVDTGLDANCVSTVRTRSEAMDSKELGRKQTIAPIILRACDDLLASFLRDGVIQAMSIESSDMCQSERRNKVEESVQSIVYTIEEGTSIDSTPVSESIQTNSRIEYNDIAIGQTPGQTIVGVTRDPKGQVAGVNITPTALAFFSEHFLDECMGLAFHNFISLSEVGPSVISHDSIARAISPFLPPPAARGDANTRPDDSVAARAVATYFVGDPHQFVKDLEMAYLSSSPCAFFNLDGDTARFADNLGEPPTSALLKHLSCDQVQGVMKKGILLALKDVIRVSRSSVLGKSRLIAIAEGNEGTSGDHADRKAREEDGPNSFFYSLPLEWEAAVDAVTERLARDLILSAGMMVLKARAYNLLYSERFTTEYGTDLDCFRTVNLHELFSSSNFSTHDLELLFLFYMEQARSLGSCGSNWAQLGNIPDRGDAASDNKLEAPEEDSTINNGNGDYSSLSLLPSHKSLVLPLFISESGVGEGAESTAAETTHTPNDPKYGSNTRGHLPPSALLNENISLFTYPNYQSGMGRDGVRNGLRGPHANGHVRAGNFNEPENKGGDCWTYANVSFMDAQRSGVSQLVLGHCLENIMDDMVMDTVTWISKLIS